MDKLNIHDTAGLTRYAISAGVIESSVQLTIILPGYFMERRRPKVEPGLRTGLWRGRGETRPEAGFHLVVLTAQRRMFPPSGTPRGMWLLRKEN
jgi:hypothetical protein